MFELLKYYTFSSTRAPIFIIESNLFVKFVAEKEKNIVSNLEKPQKSQLFENQHITKYAPPKSGKKMKLLEKT